MIGCLWTRVRKRPIIALYFESENELKFYNLEAWVTEDGLKNKMVQTARLIETFFLNIFGKYDYKDTYRYF